MKWSTRRKIRVNRSAAAAALMAALLAAGASPVIGGEHYLVLKEDVPLPGRPTRFDYQSLDAAAARLYLNHMGDGELIVFDTGTRKVVAHRPGFPSATGVIVVPELHRVFVSVPGRHEVAVVDTGTLEVVAHVPDGQFPDGLAYAPGVNKVYVSDESGGKETVIDAHAASRMATIDMGGEVGNTQYDPASGLILANVQTRGEIVAIDPRTDRITSRHRLKGGEGPHGLLIDGPKRLAFAACEGNAKLLVVDLESFAVTQVLETGEDPDVLAFDPGLERLYVASESGVVSIFRLRDRTLEKLEDFMVAPNAHTIAVDPATHDVYLPLKSVDGRPTLRIMAPPLTR